MYSKGPGQVNIWTVCVIYVCCFITQSNQTNGKSTHFITCLISGVDYLKAFTCVMSLLFAEKWLVGGVSLIRLLIEKIILLYVSQDIVKYI